MSGNGPIGRIIGIPPYAIKVQVGKNIAVGVAPDLHWMTGQDAGAALRNGHGMTMTITPLGRNPWNNPKKEW